ncbi:hypothetical protein [Agrobacterium rubi]|uniref:hypothetical protein n=1 Tax=Agrobacterium rubi TaxID=28099 RepID=UPI001571D40D|nr:hypothetical protein [Agrobacterium rubi]NTE87225.1 crossover junction endodeoxyribonuclease RuvC [Agrobacterium rubi]NTF03159.1 crossover junction endodeoxyribonuclease RuvC [Agrobacterium rubi]
MSVRVLGFDISTCTGYGFWDYSTDVTAIEANIIELPESRNIPGTDKHDYSWDDWRVAQVGPKVGNVIRHYKPDIIIVEERMRFSKRGDGAFAMSNAIHGAIYSHCCSFNLLFGTIASQSWRVPAYGEGFKQPLLPDLDRSGIQKKDKKTGKPLFKLKDWKEIAVEKCVELGIHLPGKKATAHNAAEAALIAMMWRCHKRISIPEKRAYDKYIELLQRPKTPKAVAA